jgi:hypothetical protein
MLKLAGNKLSPVDTDLPLIMSTNQHLSETKIYTITNPMMMYYINIKWQRIISVAYMGNMLY